MGRDAPQQVQWARVSAQGAVHTGRGSLAEAAVQAGQARVVLLAPAADVLLTRVELPARNKQALQAVPYALEEELAADPETLHFAHAWTGQGHELAVAVVARAGMERWQALLAEAGLEADSLLPEQLVLPNDRQQAVLVADDGPWLLRGGPWQGMAVDRANLAQVLTGALEPEHVVSCWFGAEDGLPADRPHEIGTGQESVMALLAAGVAAGEGAIDLLQGPYGRHAQWGRVWQNWRWPLALLVFCLLLAGGLRGQEYRALALESQELETRINEVLLSTFPGTKRIVNARSQMEQKLKELGAGQEHSRFLSLLERSGPHLVEIPQFRLKSLRYDQEALELDLQLKDLQSLDRLKERIVKEPGLRMEVKAAASKGGRVTARMKIWGEGS